MTFDANGGSVSTSSATTKDGKLESLPTPTRSGYDFLGWYTEKTGGEKVTTDTIFTVDTTIYAHWQKESSSGGSGGSSYDYYTITASAGTGGSISPSGSVSVREDTDKTFTITPDSGYHISDVLVDGKSVGTVTSHTFEDVQKKHTIEAVFAKDNPDIGVDNPFTDVHPDDWFYEAVMFVYQNNLMNGTSATTFSSNTPLTREMLAVVLYNVEGQPESTEANTFTDVKGDMWYTDAILWANANGIVAGYDNGAYGVGDFITREQFATILYRYAQFKGYDTTQGGMAVREFSDYETISDYARPAMAWAVNAGIMDGMDDGTLMPHGKTTRAEAATMLMNFCENVVK